MKKLLLVTAAVCALPAIASADEVLKWRHIQHTSANQSIPVGDVEGHALSVYRIPGMGTLPDGSTVKTQVIGQSDVVKGSGPARGYLLVTFRDGSELYASYSGELKRESGHTPRGGTFTITGGKGRYAGATGDGTWNGDGNFAGDPDALAYIDVILNVKK